MLLVFSQSVALDPEFSKKRTKMYVTGGTKVCCCSCSFFVSVKNNNMTCSHLKIKKILNIKNSNSLANLAGHYGNPG